MDRSGVLELERVPKGPKAQELARTPFVCNHAGRVSEVKLQYCTAVLQAAGRRRRVTVGLRRARSAKSVQ